MTDNEFTALSARVATWDKTKLSGLIGRSAVAYAEAHEADVRRLADYAWDQFPFTPRWFKTMRALSRSRVKSRAIEQRAQQIVAARASAEAITRALAVMSHPS